ncbi:hypothetical protein CASFOL_033041 [Castilleja foliolosa]|uniref:BTB domain-containing protein n=1 Tax=Castilleja foliolosa TaxID=1961234 RepID=A0ABD3C364_9LAMI
MATATNLRIRVEDKEFVISRSGASLSAKLKKMLDDGASDVITLYNIDSRNFSMIISYLETHAAVDLSDEEKRDFDGEFASGKDFYFLKKLMLDAHHLKIEALKGILAPKVADVIKILTEKWIHREGVDAVQAPGWKESCVRGILTMDWAFPDVVEKHRKRVRELLMEDLQEDTKKIRIQPMIFPVVKKQHQLLVTLLLCNAGEMEGLFLKPYGLAVCANLIWLVRILMVLSYLISYPIGKRDVGLCSNVWPEDIITGSAINELEIGHRNSAGIGLGDCFC